MKKRKSFIEKIEQVCEQHISSTIIAFSVIIVIVLFGSGYMFSSNVLQKPTSDSEFELYEQVARDVYEQGDKTIYEVPEGVSLERTDTSIIISSAKKTVRGKVIANLQNGELVLTRNEESIDAISNNILAGIFFIFATSVIVVCVSSIYEKIKRK